MCPGNRESAGKSRGGRRRKGNAYMRRIPCEVAHAATRTKDTQFGPRKRALAARQGTGRAVVTPGHKILSIAFAIRRDGVPYRDPVVDPEALTARKSLSRRLRMVRKAELLPEVARRVQAELLRQQVGREKWRPAESAPALEPGSGAAERPALS